MEAQPKPLQQNVETAAAVVEESGKSNYILIGAFIILAIALIYYAYTNFANDRDEDDEEDEERGETKKNRRDTDQDIVAGFNLEDEVAKIEQQQEKILDGISKIGAH